MAGSITQHEKASGLTGIQGCSVLSIEAQLGERLIPTESGGVSVLPDGSDLVEAKYVGGEAAEPCKDTGVGSDTGGVFTER